MVLLTGDAPAQRRADWYDDELAALIVRRDGHINHWRSPHCTDDPLVDAWERREIRSGHLYAALFARDLIALRE